MKDDQPDIIKSVIRYEPTTGKFFWLKRTGGEYGGQGYVLKGKTKALACLESLSWRTKLTRQQREFFTKYARYERYSF